MDRTVNHPLIQQGVHRQFHKNSRVVPCPKWIIGCVDSVSRMDEGLEMSIHMRGLHTHSLWNRGVHSWYRPHFVMGL